MPAGGSEGSGDTAGHGGAGGVGGTVLPMSLLSISVSSVIKAKRTLTAILFGTATAMGLAAPAYANPVTDNNFLGALTNAGIGYNDAASTEQLGRSICPMLVEPGKSMASVYSTVTNNGINPQMAAFFTGVAISMYCSSAMSSIGNGTFLNQLSGLNGFGIPGL